MWAEQQRAAERKDDVAALAVRLAAWSQKIDESLARANRLEASARDGFRIRIDGLRARHTALQERLGRYEAGGGQTWAAFQSGIRQDWESFGLAIEDLA